MTITKALPRSIGLAQLPAHIWFAAGAILAGLLAVAFWIWTLTPHAYTLRFGVREELGFRSDTSSVFRDEAAKFGLVIVSSPSDGSGADSLHRIASGELDVAVVLADSVIDDPNVCQVAFLRGEPLQLFVKPGLAVGGIGELKGRRLNLGPQTGETHPIAEKVLKHMGLKPGVDYQEENYTARELLELPPERFPDAVFTSAPLPWDGGQQFVKQYGLRLAEIPFGEALALRNPAVEDLSIPIHTYGFTPPVPDRPIHTVATHRLLIANRNVPEKAIQRLLQVIYESDFARRAAKPPVDLATATRVRRYPLHPGVVDYLHRNDPLVDRDLVERVTDLRSFIVSSASAAILLWSWYRRRRSERLDRYFDEISRWEIEAWRAACDGRLDDSGRQSLLTRLMELKMAVLQKQRTGDLSGDGQLAGFFARIEDAHRSLEVMATVKGPGGSQIRSTASSRNAA